MIETMLSNGMSVSQIAKSVSKSKEENYEFDFVVTYMVAFYGGFL